MTNKMDRSRKIATRPTTTMAAIQETVTESTMLTTGRETPNATMKRKKLSRMTTSASTRLARSWNCIFFLVLLTVSLQLIAAQFVHSSALEPTNEKSKLSTRYHTRKDCFKFILRKCGHRFIKKYRSVAEDSLGTNEDILTKRCELRDTFFSCLNRKHGECKSIPKHHHSTPKPAENVFFSSNNEIQFDAEPHQSPKLSKRLRKARKGIRTRARYHNERWFKEQLANTIWDTRMCIFRGIITIHSTLATTEVPLP